MYPLLYLLLLSLASGALVYPVRVESSSPVTYYNSSIKFYSYLKWNTNFVYTQLKLINLQYNRDIFDYCDISKYTPEGVEMLLQAHHVNTTSAHAQWIAVRPRGKKTRECLSVHTPLTLQERYNMYWDATYASYIQQTGKI